MADWTNALTRARAHAPFLAKALERQPELAALLEAGEIEAALDWARARFDTSSDVGVAMRRERLALACALAIGDLAGALPLARVMEELSALADRSLDRAIREAVSRRVPDAEPAGFFALALGKHGARELNYSSDIDPILLFDPETLPRRERDGPGEAAQRYAREIVQLLSTQTGEGYVFRVDLRLRPASEISPLAVSVNAALTHYESSALAWERAAFIRARAAAGDVDAARGFLDHIRPFVWRRSLDFQAIEEVRRLTERIRQDVEGPAEPGPGFDVKRGRGGIREVEFFAQTHQLIHGGRDPSLRTRSTRGALDALAAAGHIAPHAAQELGEAYDRLRTVEHRLQMVADRQTHTLPGGDALDGVAKLDGLEDGPALLDELQGITALVAAHYDALLGEEPQGPPAEPRPSVPEAITARLARWPEKLRILRSSEAQQAFAAVREDLAESLAAAPDPDRSLARWETLLERLPSAINLFRLFEARPGLLEQVSRAIALAPPLADALGRRLELLDALIDARAMDLPPAAPELAARMARVDGTAAYEDRLDRIRQVVGEERFALGMQLVEARHDPLAIAAGLARLAEAALETGAAAAIEEFEAAHGRVPGGALVILGLGRLGGGSLTHASDLDIIYLFTGDIGVESDGPRPLTASLYFNRLAARVTAALSVATAEGALYEVDTRLRPQGAQGPLAVSMESFAQYQQRDAWTWEHMALARARPVFGPKDAKAQLAETVREVLLSSRDPAKLRTDVLAMRADMAAAKPPRGPLDVKLLRGGLVDCEFLVHFLQLRDGAALDPDLGTAIAGLCEAGLLPVSFAAHHDLLTRMLVAQRLLAPDANEPPEIAQHALAAACKCVDYPALLQACSDARHGVAQSWAEIFGETLETDT
ncbi:hypothetical protein [Paraurantiacibacter namhicola]|uniref:Glutamate-ammonia-ligase adenylyltransferase n=1 Tax=Paraurantiacibacter namhicola TaxID=645517 RepID=A0A1C7D6E2_9SPHN|nr:hypothetical protein [Paraurantiacibacter namhicola]ANU06891.1 Glutamate-ammonia-ligase adenylyltransferase [Paraurantiacibacter namhicola]